MKIKRSALIEMIEEEVRSALTEAGKGKKGKKPQTAAADDEHTDASPDGGGVEVVGNAPPIDGGLKDQESGEDQDLDSEPETEDPTDGQGPDDEEAIDATGEGGEKPSGAVNSELSGKTVQAITVEPKGKNIPGSKEVVVTFNETSDQLRIILSASGEIKFGWPCDSTGKARQLHDLP
jgi:hypothetical protein